MFVTVGTDYHPFHRLVDWVDRWAAEEAAQQQVLVQGGTSRPARTAEFRSFLDIAEMERAVREAAVVISHGGPGTIMLCRRFGKKPIVVPRRRALGEHVDDHQVRFAERLAAAGHVTVAHDLATLRPLLEASLRDPSLARVDPHAEETSDAIRAFSQRVERLFGSDVNGVRRGPLPPGSGRVKEPKASAANPHDMRTSAPVSATTSKGA